jgi:uncharacterized membrane-anchored protein
MDHVKQSRNQPEIGRNRSLGGEHGQDRLVDLEISAVYPIVVSDDQGRQLGILLLDVLVLGYVGGAEANARNVILGQIASAYYFAHFLIILPWVARSERPRPLPKSITEAVLAKHGGTSLAHSAAQA